MSLRKLISTAVKTDSAMTEKIGRRFYAASSLGKGNIPAKPKFPFVLYREFDELPFNVAKDTAPNVVRRVFQFYIHDERGGYSRIESIVLVLRETVRGVTGEVSEDGVRCLDATWIATSADTEDPTYDSDMKYVTFTFVSTQ